VRLRAVAAANPAEPWFGGEVDLLLRFQPPPRLSDFYIIYQED